MSDQRFATVVGGRPGSRRSSSLELSAAVRSFLGRLLDERDFRADFLIDPGRCINAHPDLKAMEIEMLTGIDPARVRMLDQLTSRGGSSLRVLAASVAAAAIFLGLQTSTVSAAGPADKMERPVAESLNTLDFPGDEADDVILGQFGSREVALGTDETALTGSVGLNQTSPVQIIRPDPQISRGIRPDFDFPNVSRGISPDLDHLDLPTLTPEDSGSVELNPDPPRPVPHPIAPGGIRPDPEPSQRPQISRGIRPNLNMEGGHRPQLPLEIEPSPAPPDDGRFMPCGGIRPDLEDDDLTPAPVNPDGE